MVHAIKATEFIDKIKFACETRDELDLTLIMAELTHVEAQVKPFRE